MTTAQGTGGEEEDTGDITSVPHIIASRSTSEHIETSEGEEEDIGSGVRLMQGDEGEEDEGSAVRFSSRGETPQDTGGVISVQSAELDTTGVGVFDTEEAPPLFMWIIFIPMILLGFWLYGKRYKQRKRDV